MRAMTKRSDNLIRSNEQGMVAIIVTMLIMIIITLIVSSFALIVRREQRQSLDRQLSSQAFYAAEAGISAAKAWRRVSPDGGATYTNANTKVSTCGGADAFPYADYGNGQLDGDNVKYSCVLINPTPNRLVKDSVEPGESFVLPITTASGTPVNTLEISWENKGGGDNFGGADFILPQDAPLKTAMLRTTLIGGFSSGAKNRQDLLNGTRTMLMYPTQSGSPGVSSTPFGQPSDSGAIVSGNCNTNNRSTDTYACRVRITGLGESSYFLHTKALYQATKITITSFDGSSHAQELAGAQTVIDSTGKAAEVLRRVQVRVPSPESEASKTLDFFRPGGALETTNDICKLLKVTSTQFMDECTGTTWTNTTQNSPGTTGTNNPSGGGAGGGEGDAKIGECEAGNQNCTADTKDPNAPEFVWTRSFLNNSQNNQSVIRDCIWDWGDGSLPQTFPASQCEYEDRVSHEFKHTNPDLEQQIRSTNGAQGCYIYTVKLTMRFTAASGFPDKVAVPDKISYVPGGKANDIPEGICNGHWRKFPG